MAEKLEFNKFKVAVARQFTNMSKGELFCVQVDKDAMWNVYLDSYPDGTNEVYRERRENDCSCCRAFVKRVGNVVSLIDGKIVTIWDGLTGEPAYDEVSRKMGELIRQHPLDNKFLTPETVAGVDRNFEQLTDHVHIWEHFFVNIPSQFRERGEDIGPKLSEVRASHDVLLRSLTELTKDSVEIVLELIAQGSLYRGEEHGYAVRTFWDLKQRFNKIPDGHSRDLFVWEQLHTVAPAVARIRNTSIGTLLIDLSEGLDLEDAVRRYESVVAPTNYKRPTALVTQKMVDKAKETIQSLGLTSALARRYASIDDVYVNDLLYVDRNSRGAVDTDAFSGIAAGSSAKALDRVESVSIQDFITNVLPKAQSFEVMFEGWQIGNLMSLVTAVDPSATQLFKWDNPFSWSYNGDLADSIRERVKKAGGSVEGDLCCRLAWYNHDDLDFHMLEPGRYEIAFPNKGRTSPNGGMLDVDMNAGSGQTREPVENIFYTSKKHMKEGGYRLFVHQYAMREPRDTGFDVEIEVGGLVTQFSYPNSLMTGKALVVADIIYKDGGFKIEPHLPATSKSREIWGLKTNEFHRVKALFLSPNYWGSNTTGNKHFFFILDGCKNDGQARGFFNEFLRSDLDQHRKVIEIVGSKMRTEESSKQLSGLGFSSTKRAQVIVRVTGAFSRTLKLEI